MDITVERATGILRAAVEKYNATLNTPALPDLDEFQQQCRQAAIDAVYASVEELASDAEAYNYQFSINKSAVFVPAGEEYLFHVLPSVFWTIRVVDGTILVR
jgi:hypothetical protein